MEMPGVHCVRCGWVRYAKRDLSEQTGDGVVLGGGLRQNNVVDDAVTLWKRCVVVQLALKKPDDGGIYRVIKTDAGGGSHLCACWVGEEAAAKGGRCDSILSQAGEIGTSYYGLEIAVECFSRIG